MRRYETWQDEALARAAKAGDREARNALFLRHMELVKRLGGHARRRLRMAWWAGHANARLDPEDIDQQAFLAFCEVLAAWQPDRGEPFLALLSRKLPWLLRTYLHGMLTGKRSEPYPQTTPFDPAYEKPGERTPSDASQEAESSIGWCRQIDTLPQHLRGLVALRYGNDLTSAQVAYRAGHTRRQVNRKLQEAVSILRANMQEDWEDV